MEAFERCIPQLGRPFLGTANVGKRKAMLVKAESKQNQYYESAKKMRDETPSHSKTNDYSDEANHNDRKSATYQNHTFESGS